MKYDSIFSRSFSYLHQKRLQYAASACCCLIALYFCTVLNPSLNPLVLKMQLSVGVGLEMLQVKQTNRSHHAIEVSQVTPMCNVLKPRTEFCEIMNKNVRVDAKSSSVFVDSSSQIGNRSWTIRPYARKEDKNAMVHVRAWSVTPLISDSEIPQCTRYHSVPAILFSNGGYAGNHFHEFTDVVIPLFITSRKYDGKVQFLVSDSKSWWIAKFQAVLRELSKYEIIDIDKQVHAVHCFPSITVGLKRHAKDMTFEHSKHSYSMKQFRDFLRNTYSLKRGDAIRIRDGGTCKKPHLLIMSRRGTRRFINLTQITEMGRSLGYKVTTAEADKNVSRIAEAVNSCDVLMGVHGAGLTNILFLPENAVLIQILPLGGFEWIAENYFGEPSKDMNLKYLEYKISKEESTLKIDPQANRKQGWKAFKSTYLNAQDIKLNVSRFKPTLLKALQLLHY